MESIAKPNKINFKKGEKDNQSIVTVEPFYPGYGMTIGNSIRRVLLSSLEGSAVVGVKIKGATHEFSSISHIKEDVLEIIMNLKQLRLKIFSDEEIKLELDVHGKKQVKASDIKKNSQVEIVNPDLNIVNITDMAGSLSMEIFIGRGRGYRPVEVAEDKEKKNEIGYIEMDAIFSPVLAVGLNVENVRVGNMTNWDKLIMDIITDGTMEPEEAFNNSIKMLVEQFKSLSPKVEKQEKSSKKEEDKKEKKDASTSSAQAKKEVKEEKKKEKEEEKEEKEDTSASSAQAKKAVKKSTSSKASADKAKKSK